MKQKKRSLRGFSLIELLIVISIILIIVSFAVPKMNKILMHSRETVAAATIKNTIHTQQALYYSQFGRFAQSLQELGPPTTGADNASAANLIPSELAKGEKGGYKFAVIGTPTGYQVNAEPVAFGNTGSKTYFSDQSQVIHVHSGQEPATATDPEIK